MRDSQPLKNAIKDLGYTLRQVSVKVDGSSFILTIRDASVNYAAIDALESQFEKIHRCPGTHEILLGGNTYVDIELTDAVKEEWRKPYLAKVEEAISKLYDDRHGMSIDERFTVYSHFPDTFNRLKVWDNQKGGWLQYDYCEAKSLALDLFIESQAAA